MTGKCETCRSSVPITTPPRLVVKVSGKERYLCQSCYNKFRRWEAMGKNMHYVEEEMPPAPKNFGNLKRDRHEW
jgi:hypothetical protein